MKMARRRALIPAAVLALGLVISGCSSNQSNGADAAVVGDTRITNEQLDAEVNAVLSAEAKPAGTVDAELVTNTLNFLILNDLLQQVAQDNDVSVTQGEIDRTRQSAVQSAGSEAKLEAALLQQQRLAPSQIDSYIRFQLVQPKIAAAVAPGADQQTAGTALRTTVEAKSNALDPEVNPRYGTWDSSQLQVISGTGSISTPLPTPTPTGAIAQ